MSRSRLIFGLIAIFGGAVILTEFWRYHGFFTDDSFISLRYAHNLLTGHGLVWNAGERVEGYSNFLLVILVAALGRLGLDLKFASQVIGVASYAGIVIFTARHCARKFGFDHDNVRLTLWATLLCGTSLPLVVWSVGGLETVLFSLLVTAGVLKAIDARDSSPHQSAMAGTILALATLTRPDALLFFGIIACFYLISIIRRTPQAAIRLAALAIPYVILVGSHEIWRYSYYGQFLPNTWYVKGGFGWEKAWLGCLYLGDFIVSPPYLMILFIAAGLYRALTRTWNAVLSLLTVSIMAYVAYVIYAGGDHMPGFRLIVAIIPLMIITTVWAIRPLVSRLSARGKIAAEVLPAVLVCIQVAAPGRSFDNADRWDDAAYSGMIVGRYINDNWPSGSLVALNSAGATPYYAENLRFLDMLGLNDTTIARRQTVPIVSFYQMVPGHAKGDGEYVFERKPDFIIAGPSNGADLYHSLTLSEYELARIYDFKRQYALRSVKIPVTGFDRYRLHEDTKSGTMTFTYYQRQP